MSTLTLDQAVSEAMARMAAPGDDVAPAEALPEGAPVEEIAPPAEEIAQSPADGEPETSEINAVEDTVPLEEISEEPPAEPAPATVAEIDRSAVYRLADGQEMSGEELLGGGLRQADYTRKAQRLASLNDQIEAEAAAIQQQRAQIEAAQAELQASALLGGREPMAEPQMPDASMMETDPIGYSEALGHYMRDLTAYQQQQQAVEQARQAQAQRQRQMQTQALGILQQQAGWQDDHQARAEIAALAEVAAPFGFDAATITREAVGSPNGARVVALMAHLARQAGLIQSAAPANGQPRPVTPKPPPAVPAGNAVQPANRQATAQQQARDAEGRFAARKTQGQKRDIDAAVDLIATRLQNRQAQRQPRRRV